MKLSSVINSSELPKYNAVVTDSREVKDGDLFIAINTGINYVEEALSRGAAAAVVTAGEKKFDGNIIYVTDTLTFLGELAKLELDKWRHKKKVVGITGSSGKTTTKDMLYFLLDSKFKGSILATTGNHNNSIGVPQTILELNEKHQVAIIEMGSNHPGEIKHLVDMVNPDYGFITNVGDSHLEFFHNREGVFYEKKALVDNIMDNEKVFIANNDDEFLKRLDGPFITFGQEDSDYIVNYEDNTLNGIPIVNNHILGEHNFANLIAAVVIAHTLFKEVELLEWIKYAGEFVPLYNRSSWIVVKNCNIMLDAYNANPSSMQSGLESFYEYLKDKDIELDRSFLIIGDMNELGEQTENKHYMIGKLINNFGFNNVAFIGQYRENYMQGFGKKALLASSYSKFKKFKDIVSNFDYLFIKGSRSLSLEKLL